MTTPRNRFQRLCALTSVLLVWGSGASIAYGIPTPADPEDPVYQQQWVNPDIRTSDSDSQYTLELTELPQHLHLNQTLQLRVRVQNNSDQDITTDEGAIVVRRADATSSVATTREIIAGTTDNYPYYATAIPLEADLPAGSSQEITVEIPLDPAIAGGLTIHQGGSYPILVGLQSSQLGLLDTQRFALYVEESDTPEAEIATTVLDDATTDADQDAADSGVPEAAAALPATAAQLVVPITTTINMLSGETGEAPQRADLVLEDDAFVAELQPDGRLYRLLEDYEALVSANPEMRTATCLAIDPQLVDVANRMSGGYFLSAERPKIVSTQKRLRDSWGSSDDDIVMESGAHSAVAGDWLQYLKKVAHDSCTVALPWANTDVNAVGSINNPWLMREALQTGPQILADVLDVQPQSNVVLPGTGYITPAATNALGWATLSADAPNINTEWEQSLADTQRNASSSGGESALDAEAQQTTAAPAPAEEISVLVSDNSVWGPVQAGRFAQLDTGIHGVLYPGSLAATLAETGTDPLTVGYSNAQIRFDYTIDSASARETTAVAAIYQTIHNSTEPVLITLPSLIDDLTPYGEALSQLLSKGAATPIALKDYVQPSSADRRDLAAAADATASSSENEGHAAEVSAQFGAPYPDPTVVAETEILTASQQATYADDLTRLMIPDAAIALTPYGFTAPLRQDILQALSINKRQSKAAFRARTEEMYTRLVENRTHLIALRSSVALIPPGNLYTRTSDTAPLLIAARNGLPLPVDAQLLYEGPSGAALHVDNHIIIPAKGSLTVQMTADIPSGPQRTDLKLWLANQEGDAITTPVSISVQTRSGVAGLSGIAITLVIALMGLLAVRLVRQIKAAPQQRQARRSPKQLRIRVNGRNRAPRKQD